LNLQFLASAEAAKSNAYQFHYGQNNYLWLNSSWPRINGIYLPKIRFVIESNATSSYLQYTPVFRPNCALWACGHGRGFWPCPSRVPIAILV